MLPYSWVSGGRIEATKGRVGSCVLQHCAPVYSTGPPSPALPRSGDR